MAKSKDTIRDNVKIGDEVRVWSDVLGIDYELKWIVTGFPEGRRHYCYIENGSEEILVRFSQTVDY